MDQSLLQWITTPLGASILLIILSTIVFYLASEKVTWKSTGKFLFYISIVTYGVISLNNHYILSDFENEPIIGGSFADFNPV